MGRGRTLNNSFVILDEAQNTTPAQMKMVLTRLGFRSKMVVTGDITQTDLPLTQKSGLLVVIKILRHVEGISICELSQGDVKKSGKRKKRKETKNGTRKRGKEMK